MAEAFVKTMKRDYVRVSPLPDARTVMETLPLWIEHYNSLHPHKALGYRPPASSSRIKPNLDRVRSFGGNNRVSKPTLSRLLKKYRVWPVELPRRRCDRRM